MVTYEIVEEENAMVISRIRMFINVEALLRRLKSRFNCEGEVVKHDEPYHEIMLEGCKDMNAVRKVVEGAENESFGALQFLLAKEGISVE